MNLSPEEQALGQVFYDFYSREGDGAAKLVEFIGILNGPVTDSLRTFFKDAVLEAYEHDKDSVFGLIDAMSGMIALGWRTAAAELMFEAELEDDLP